MSPSAGFYVVAEKQILVAQVQFAVGDERVRPGWLLGAVGLLETAALDVMLAFGSIRSTVPFSVR